MIQKMVARRWSGIRTLTCSSARMLPTSCRRRSYLFDIIASSALLKKGLYHDPVMYLGGGFSRGDGDETRFCIVRRHGVRDHPRVSTGSRGARVRLVLGEPSRGDRWAGGARVGRT